MVHVKKCPLVANGKSKRRGRASMDIEDCDVVEPWMRLLGRGSVEMDANARTV